MENQFVIVDKALLHKEDRLIEFLDTASAELGPIEMIYQRRARFHPDKVILELEIGMKPVDSTDQP